MDILNRITIKARLVLTFTIMIVLFIGYSALSLLEMNKLGNLTSILYEHPLQVSNAALRAGRGVIKMHRSMNEIPVSLSDEELKQAVEFVQSEEDIVYEQLNIIKSRILGQEGKNLEDKTRRMFADWKPIRDKIIRLYMEGNKKTAAIINRKENAEYVSRLEKKMLELRKYATTKADGFMSNAKKVQEDIIRNTVVIVMLGILLLCIIAYLMPKSILSNISALKAVMSEITSTGFFAKSDLPGNNEITEMAWHFNLLIEKLQKQFWLRDGLNSLNNELSGGLSYDDLAANSINFVSRYADACAGALYTYDKKSSLCELKGSYAFVEREYLSSRFKSGEGIVGQVAVEKKPVLLKNITREQALGNTGTASEPPKNIYAVPLMSEKELYGVLEIASFEDIGNLKKDFLNSAARIISTALYTSSQNEQIRELLESTQVANEKLQSRTDELNKANEKLKALNEELQAQSDELQAQAQELHAQKTELETQRIQVEEADRLKSEFLSNMSHELRTPLNSVLALSQLMISRGTGKSPEQETEYLKVIERNGRRLLSLINDILDLSKIEAGRMDIYMTEFDPGDVVQQALETVMPIADEKGLKLSVNYDDKLTIHSDEDKLNQILLNLFSNAVKFTKEGEIEIRVWESEGKILFAVRDTGIGISEKDMSHIFDEFRQADGSTTRQHEGTGLGLAICQKLAKLLGGAISAESAEGRGSTFTLTLPSGSDIKDYQLKTDESDIKDYQLKTDDHQPKPENQQTVVSSGTVLVIDDDEEVCAFLKDYLTGAGYQVIVAQSGKQGLEIAHSIKPFAITLDIMMPETDGWEVIRHLKDSAETAHIPVIVVSVGDDRATGMAMGAAAYITKPVDRRILLSEIEKIGVFHRIQRILVVDDDPIVLKYVEDILGGRGYLIEKASGGKEAIARIAACPPDIIILDLMMPDTDGFTVLDHIRGEPLTRNIPVIILTAKELTQKENNRLKNAVHHIVTKGKMEKDRFLRNIEDILKSLAIPTTNPDTKKKPLVLVVEDNEVAMLQILSALEEGGYAVHTSFSGTDALKYVEKQTPDAVILDLMMPDIDGFQVLEQIRSTSRTYNLPVLVLTAKELTPADRTRLKHDNIRQLIQKGSINRDHLKLCVAKLFEPHRQTGTESKTGETRAEENKPEETFKPSVDTSDVILIVEDNSDNLLTMTAILDEFGYKYLIANDGYEAIKTAKETHPRIILMDIQLPGLSGLDAAQKIKSDPSMAEIRIIAVTAKAMSGDREKIIAAGCDDYLSKPIDPSLLIDKIRKVI
ncbi:MAG: response regulator [Desulfobacterales bacterium]|nr:response regulator [Desulfobacterales bacterium]